MRRPGGRSSSVAALTAVMLFSMACGSAVDGSGDPVAAPEPVQVDESLGVVRLAPGERIQLRSLVDAVDGGAAADPQLDALIDTALRVALEDFGGIQGFRVELGEPVAADCSAEGGAAAATVVLDDPDVVGAFGPSCLASLITALTPLGGAGMVVLSATATAPELTQSPFGEAGVNRSPALHRTAPNALAEALAAATFAIDELGLQRAVTVEDGSAHAAGMAAAFRTEFESLGGTVVRSSIVLPSVDPLPELESIDATEPDLLFLTLGPERLLDLVESWGEVSGSSGTVLIATSLALDLDVLSDPRSEDLYLTGPWLDVTDAQSSVTGIGAGQVIERVGSLLGLQRVAGWWAHAYDAMTLLLRAIDDVSLVEADGTLVISRADLRRALVAPGFTGMTGRVECDAFGDCGTRRSVIVLREGGTVSSLDDLLRVFDTGARTD
jgi:branched-chain amino acid transport system substrate-binding protein